MTKMATKAIAALSLVGGICGVLKKLLASFNISVTTRQKAIEYKEQLQLEFKKFEEKTICKWAKGIKLDDFEKFIIRQQRRHNFPDKIKDCIIDGIYTDEQNETCKDFQFKDGEGTISYMRIYTVRKEEDQKIDVAYAIYSLDFELSEKVIKKTIKHYFMFIPLGCEEVIIAKEPQTLNDTDKKKFYQLCELELHDTVKEEFGD